MKIAAYGDSIQYGSTLVAGRYIQSADNTPTVLQQLLQTSHSRVTVENKGITGTSLSTEFVKLLHGSVGTLQQQTCDCEHLKKRRRRHFANSPFVRTVAST